MNSSLAALRCVPLSQVYRAWITFLVLLGPGIGWSATPIRVRLLGREHPGELVVTAKVLKCGDAKLPERRVVLTPEGLRVRALERNCSEVTAPEGATLLAKGVEPRSYGGAVEVRSDGAGLIIDERPALESYVSGVIAVEADVLPSEALRAQAIVSRTWAIANTGRHADAGYDLCDLTHCQLYRGLTDSKAAIDAANDTTGKVLRMQDGGVVDAAFHQSCGGATSDARDVFGQPGPLGVRDVDDRGRPLCQLAPNAEWTFDASAASLAKALGGVASEPLRISSRDAAGRALELSAFGKRVKGPLFLATVQRAFGYDSLRSLRFTFERDGDRLHFVGRGVGHGVGFCQYGAAAMAKTGADAEAIVRHYFPPAAVQRMP